MQKKLFLYVVLAAVGVGAVIGFLLAAGSRAPVDDAGKPKVAATIFPLYDITKNVAGDSAEVELLLPPGASPHFYEFTPRQLSGLAGTRLVFAIGHGIDDWALKATDSIGGVEIIVVDEGIELRGTVEYEDGENRGSVDPHYWLHFGNARIIADTVAGHLGRIDPDNAEQYLANAAAYKAVLNAEEANLKEKMAPLVSKELLTLHDSWYYFADNFELNIAGTFEPSAGKEPTPRYLADLQDAIRENNVSVIFSEPQYSNAALASFVADNELGLAVLDPIGGTEETGSFLEVMRYNVNNALEALEAVPAI